MEGGRREAAREGRVEGGREHGKERWVKERGRHDYKKQLQYRPEVREAAGCCHGKKLSDRSPQSKEGYPYRRYRLAS